MAQTDKNTLKGYFRTGARPTEGQFAELIDAVPTPQTSVNGTDNNYVYSTGTKSLDSVVAVKYTGLLQNEGRLVFRAHAWNNKEEEGNYFSTPVPKASTIADGAMSKDVFNRLGTGASISEGVRGADAVTINYPNWAAGGTRTFTLRAATTINAGVMSVADKKTLDLVRSARIININCLANKPNTPYYSFQEALAELVSLMSGLNQSFLRGETITFLLTGDDPWSDPRWVTYQWQYFGSDPAPDPGAPEQWTLLYSLGNAVVYAKEGMRRKAVNGIFSLTTASTDAEIKAALTEFETKNVLTLTDLQYCAKYGCMLYDQQTQGFVQVTNSGGGTYFNFIELSATDYRYMPCLRYVGILADSADNTFRVVRDAMEQRICYKSELDALAARVAALEGQDKLLLE